VREENVKNLERLRKNMEKESKKSKNKDEFLKSFRK
jgi:hypothetical protein